MNKTVGRQIWFLMAIAFGFLGFIIFGGAFSINKISGLTQKLYNHPYTVSNSVRDIKIGTISINKYMQDVANTESSKDLSEITNMIDQEEKKIFQAIEVIMSAFLGDKKEISSLKKDLIAWKDMRGKIFDLSMNANKSAELLISKNEGNKQVDMIAKKIDSMLSFANNKGIEFIGNTTKLQEKTLNVFIFGSFFILILLSAVSHLTIRKIKNNLCQASQGISTQSSNINSNVLQLTSVGKDLLDASHQQASFLSSTVEAVTELQATAANTSDRSKQASTIADKNKTIARKGKASLSELSDAIKEIQKANKEVVNTVTKNNQDVGNIVVMIQEISDKTQIINDIVFQTKLLSFNASVEAARAGEHGKGFSVVAEEIGNLANLSGVAATEINQMLEARTLEIKQLVVNASKTIESLVTGAREKVQKGMDLSGECQKSFNNVTLNADQINSLISEVDNMTDEQLSAIRLVQQDVTELNHLSKKYQDSSEKTHNMSNNLLDGQKNLNTVVVTLKDMINSGAA
jgi:methyl-accepting chemotaxis protein